MTRHGERILALYAALFLLVVDAGLLLVHFGFTLSAGVSINWPAVVAVNAIAPLLLVIEMARTIVRSP